MRWYRKAAVNGHAKAPYELVSILCEGLLHGVPENDAEGIEWYKQAAYQGYIPAIKKMGQMYWSGENLSKDIVKAYSWYSVLVKRTQGMKGL